VTGRVRLRAAALLLVACGAGGARTAAAQTLTYRGFADVGLMLFPQTAPNDSTQAVGDAQFRLEPSLEIRRGFSASASLEARIGSHDQTTGAIAFWDRTLQRPALAVRTLTMTIGRGPLTIEVGKQFVRWGQSDILSPTDYFTAKDYLVTASSEALATTAGRLTLANQNAALEFVYAPRMTPSRMPLLNQRWIGLQAAAAGLPLVNGETSAPDGSEYGIRWHHVMRHLEYSATFFQGFNHLPVLNVALAPTRTAIRVDRRYPAIRAWGTDVVAPLPGLTLKLEAAWLQARFRDADDYGLWVIQGERQQGPWLFTGGYVGEHVTEDRGVLSFAPDRGLARSVIGRASYTSDTSRNFVFETVARRDGDGLYTKAEYSHPLPSNWRITLQFVLLRGEDDDFLGQYRRNSFTRARARLSF